MFIQQRGKPARTGGNGGARNAGFVQVRPGSNNGFTQIHPVPPGFQNTRVQGAGQGLHQLVRNVNLASAIRQIAGAMMNRPGGPPRPSPGVPAILGGGVRRPMPFPLAPHTPGLVGRPDMAALGAGFAANPTLAPTQGPPIQGPTDGMPDPFQPGGYGQPNTEGIDDYLQQQLLAQRQAMVARLMRTGQMS